MDLTHDITGGTEEEDEPQPSDFTWEHEPQSCSVGKLTVFGTTSEQLSVKIIGFWSQTTCFCRDFSPTRFFPKPLLHSTAESTPRVDSHGRPRFSRLRLRPFSFFPRARGSARARVAELSSGVEGAEVVHDITEVVAVVDGDHRAGPVVLRYRLHVGQLQSTCGTALHGYRPPRNSAAPCMG